MIRRFLRFVGEHFMAFTVILCVSAAIQVALHPHSLWSYFTLGIGLLILWQVYQTRA
jgi:hypothetical protein